MSSQWILGGWAVALTLVLAGCSTGGSVDDAGGTTTTTTEVAAAAGVNTTTATRAVDVVLGPDRLLVGGNALVYGAPKSQVRAYLDRALGAPGDTAEQECGPGRVESFRWDGISAYVDESGFTGWVVDDATFATAQGLRIGSARSVVEASHPAVSVTEGSLGTEFFVTGPEDGTGLSGVFEDNAVAALWSGVTCIAR